MPIPSWISKLTDATLKADFTAFYKAGAITEPEMAKAVSDLIAEDKSAGVNLTSSQFSDLKSIAANIASMGASGYLQFITDVFVNGFPASLTFTGGSFFSYPLAQLAVGSSVGQMTELDEKWFLGEDLPSDIVGFYETPQGSAPYWDSIAITYSPVSAPLYNPATNLPSILDVNQGKLGDCYLLAPLAELAQQDPLAISKNMITDNGNGTYGVRFFVEGHATYVTVNNELADGGTIFNSAKYIWASLVESAFAQIQDEYDITGLNANPTTGANYDWGNSFTTIGNGGAYIVGLEEITGATQITRFSSNMSNWSVIEYNQSINQVGSQTFDSSAEVLSAIVADLEVGSDVTLGSATTQTLAGSDLNTLIPGHDYSVIGFDASSGLLDIRNPYGGNSVANNMVSNFEVSINTLLAAGDMLAADNSGTASYVDFAPAVAAQGLQAMSQITTFTVQDSAANVQANLSQLIGASKLQEVFVGNPGGGEANVNLTGLTAGAIIDLGLDFARATLITDSVRLGSGFDTITLGSGVATVDFWQGSTNQSVALVQNFRPSFDTVSFQLNGGVLNQAIAFDSGVGWGDYLYAANPSQGVFLKNVTTVQPFTTSGGDALVT